MIECVWLGREAAVVHAFAGVEPAIFERLALATGWRREGGRRLARCGASVRRSNALREDASGRRCRTCEQRLERGGEPAWLTRARGDEYLNGAPARPVVRADDAQGLELAERIARDVVRWYAVADGGDYLRRVQIAAAAALEIAESIRRAARAGT